MVSRVPVVRENIHYLTQAAGLIAELPDVIYQNNDHPVFMSSVGKHIRHVLDFYAAFLSGISKRIDYDARQRDLRVETDRAIARERIDNAIAGILNAVPNAKATKRSVTVKNDVPPENGEDAAFASSTIQRELLFLMSHTVHHFAIIAMILKLQDHSPPPGFGVAPSTLLHLAQTSQPSKT